MNRALVLFTLILPAFTLSPRTAAAAQDSADSILDRRQPVAVPLTYFDTPSHKVRLRFDFKTLAASLDLDGRRVAHLKPRLLPLRVLELPQDRLFIIGRHLFGGELWAALLDSRTLELQSFGLEPKIRSMLFREAAVYEDQLVVLLYNVSERRNYIYRFLLRDDGSLEFDDSVEFKLLFNGLYEISNNILTALHEGRLFICSEGTCYVYRSETGQQTKPIIDRYSLGDRVRIVELAEGEAGVAGLYQEIHETSYGNHITGKGNPFFAVDLLRQEPVKRWTEGEIPFDLRYDNGKLSWTLVRTPHDLLQVFQGDLRNMLNSGLMEFGVNNHEGRVPWLQVYYLNGLIDILRTWEGPEDFSMFDPVKKELKARLDMEIFLIDRLLDEGEPGLVSKRYSVDRSPVLAHGPRVLRLFKRYRSGVADPVDLQNYDQLLRNVENLETNASVVVKADPDDPWVKGGRYYMRLRKGIPLPLDGVNLPYNVQSFWSNGLLYGAPLSDRSRTYAVAARDMIEILFETEGFYSSFPENHEWNYWWGWGQHGWRADDGISADTPEYEGSDYVAHISYRTIDAMAMLNVGRLFPEALPDGLLDYIQQGVEDGGLYLFVSEELSLYGRLPAIPEDLAVQYLRMNSPWEIQNSAWAYRALGRRLSAAASDRGRWMLVLFGFSLVTGGVLALALIRAVGSRARKFGKTSG